MLGAAAADGAGANGGMLGTEPGSGGGFGAITGAGAVKRDGTAGGATGGRDCDGTGAAGGAENGARDTGTDAGAGAEAGAGVFTGGIEWECDGV